MDKRTYVEIRGQLKFEKSNKYIFRHVMGDLALLAVAGFLVHQGICGGALASVSLAVFMFRSFSMMHEAVHDTIHNRRQVNKWLGHIYGVCSFLPFSQWKEIHVRHHTWAGNLDLDPTMKIIKMFRDTGAKPTALQEFAWRWWLPYLAFRQQIVFWQKSFENLNRRQTQTVSAELCGMIVYIVICAGVFGLGVTLGAMLLNLILIELINFPHHMGLEQGGGQDKLVPMEQYRIARSVVYKNWFSRFALLNFNYHVEHHLFPTLPWHQLEHAHILLRSSLGDKFNLSYGNGWLKDSRKMTFLEVLQRSTAEHQDEPLQEAELVA
jgi:acyl-lipid omega-6 desaturase (Delta-12 desaturase)